MTRKREKKARPEQVTAQIATDPRRWRAPFVLPVHCRFCGQGLPELTNSSILEGRITGFVLPRQETVWVLKQPESALWRYDDGVWSPTNECLWLRTQNIDEVKQCERLLSDPARLSPSERADVERSLAELRRELQENRFPRRQRRRIGSVQGSRALPARVICPKCGVENLVPMPGISPLTG